MDEHEIKAFWHQWLADEHAHRVDTERLVRLALLGDELIHADPEFWARNSMWRLFDEVNNGPARSYYNNGRMLPLTTLKSVGEHNENRRIES